MDRCGFLRCWLTVSLAAEYGDDKNNFGSFATILYHLGPFVGTTHERQFEFHRWSVVGG